MIRLSYTHSKIILEKELYPLTIYGTYHKKKKHLFNCEHIVPQSYDQKVNGDLHLLFLSCKIINSLRNNYRFIDKIEKKDIYKFSYINYDINHQMIIKPYCNDSYECAFSHQKRSFLPPIYSRGIIARSLLYYHEKYKNHNVLDKVIDYHLLKTWNEKYKVTEAEYFRNSQIYEFQRNINPFIYYV